MSMKKLLLGLVFSVIISQSFAQYKVGFGFFLNTRTALSSPEFPDPDLNSFEFSVKAVLPDYSCYDFIGGRSKEYYNFTLMKEVHRKLFYPVDLYLGLGFHVGGWRKTYIAYNPEKKIFGGLDGDFGLQFTVMPVSVSVGWRPVWTFLGGDQFYWIKQIGIRYCL